LRRTTIYPGQRLIVYSSGSTTQPIKVTGNETVHKVKKGETLGLIAQSYGCSVSDLKRWNNLGGSTIYVNQQLYVKDPTVAAKTEKSTGTESGGYIWHTIKSGETLWDIAQKYNGVTVNQIKQLNNIKNERKLKPGQKIKISRAS
jgi:membrane-bound lytic murein transglycosylase D